MNRYRAEETLRAFGLTLGGGIYALVLAARRLRRAR